MKTLPFAILALFLPTLALVGCDASDPDDGPDGFPGDARLLGMWVNTDDGDEYLHFEHDADEDVLRLRFIEYYPDGGSGEGCFELEEVQIPLDDVTATTFSYEGTNTYSISGPTLTLNSSVEGPLQLTRSNRTLDAMTPECALGADARIASVLQQTGRDGGASWDDRAFMAYSYDERGLLAEINASSLQGNPSDEYRYMYTYDTEGRLGMAQYIYVNGETVTLYRYNPSGRLAETRTSTTGEGWDSMRNRARYFYDAQGLREQVVNEQRGESGAWQATGGSRYTYDAQGKLTEVLRVTLVDGQETPTGRDRYSYVDGFVHRIEGDVWMEGAWVLRWTGTYERDEEGRTLTQTQVWAPGSDCCAPNRYVYTWENAPGDGARAYPAALPTPGLDGYDPMEAPMLLMR